MTEKYWMRRRQHGRRPKYETADQLWKACVEYFDWVEANPLLQSEAVKYQGTASIVEVPRSRAMTIDGLCVFIGITHETWCQYRKRNNDFSEVTSEVDTIIRVQKFEGAAANLFNPSIIARDLGLSEKQKLEIESTPVDTFSQVLNEIAQQKLDLRAKSGDAT